MYQFYSEGHVQLEPTRSWSTILVFMVGHHTCEWPAAAAYGLLMAHAVTDLSLALYVVKTGSCHLW